MIQQRRRRIISVVLVMVLSLLTIVTVSYAQGNDPPGPLPEGWAEVSPMAYHRSEHPGTVLDGKIYVVGGFTSHGRDRGTAIDSLEVYDPETDTWTGLASLPVERDHNALVAFEGELYAFGVGYADPTYSYDPEQDAWRELSPMPGFRHAAQAVALGDYIYVVGGVFRGLPPLLRYDPATDTWEELALPAVAHDHGAAVVFEDQIWSIAGRDVGEEDYTLVEIYDPETDEWTQGPALNDARAGFGAAVIDGRIYVAGGEQVAAMSDPTAVGNLPGTVEMYDPDVGAWQIVATMPYPVHGMPVLSVDETLYIVGGSDEAGWFGNHGRVFTYRP